MSDGVSPSYRVDEVAREGWAVPTEFGAFFAGPHGCTRLAEIRRIEFEYVEESGGTR